MPTLEWMEEEVRIVLPDAEVTATDLTGGGDHFHLRIVDASFEGMTRLARQRVILARFKQYIPHAVHALDIQALAPSQTEAIANVFHPHAEGQGSHVKSIKRRIERGQQD